MERTKFYNKRDLRSENRELAFKLFFRELKTIDLSEQSMAKIDALLEKYKIHEEEIGTCLSIDIEFPDGVVRNQWFYDKHGCPYSLKHNGKTKQKTKKRD